MSLTMRFTEYLRILRPYSNSPLTLNRITLPFGIIAGSEENSSLLVGHVLDDLATRYSAEDNVDAIDVVASAYDLGHEPAGAFLDEAPYIMSRMAKELGLGRVH